MRRNPVKIIVLFVFLAALIMSCAKSGTRLTQQKVTEGYQGKSVSNILVIAVTDQEKSRQSFERRFVAHLKSAGVEAVSSVETLAIKGDLKLTKEQILAVVDRFGNDAVIITHLTDFNIGDVSVRAGRNYGGFYGYYGYTTNTAYDTTRTSVRLETKLYDVKTEKLIWSVQSDSWNYGSQKGRANEVIKAVVNELKKNKLIAPK